MLTIWSSVLDVKERTTYLQRIHISFDISLYIKLESIPTLLFFTFLLINIEIFWQMKSMMSDIETQQAYL